MTKRGVLLSCVLLLGSAGNLQATPLDSPDIVYIDGLPCNSLCRSYDAAPDSEPARVKIVDPQPASSAADTSEFAQARMADSHPTDHAAAASNTRTLRDQVTAATAVAERMTVAIEAPEPNAVDTDRSDRGETVPPRDADMTASAAAIDPDLLVALVMARPEMKSVSDLANKDIAIDGEPSASNGSVRTAIVAAGAGEVQLSKGEAKAIDRLIAGEVPAAVLTLVSPEAAEAFPDIAGFRIFRIPLSPKARL